MIKLIIVATLAFVLMLLYRRYHIVLYERMAILLFSFDIDVDDPQTGKTVKNILRILFIISILSTGFVFTLSPLMFTFGILLGMIPRIRPALPPEDFL